MTPDYQRFVDSSLAAERAGDAETALEFHSGVPMFARGAHRVQLTQLAGLAEEMTPWMWARWAVYQCTRTEDDSRAGEVQRAALQYTVEMFYPDRLQDAYDSGGDPVQVLAHVLGESWLMHQLCTFDFGGLAAFLDEFATDRLAAGCRLTAREWVGAPMGGYRLELTGSSSLVVRDLRTDVPVELLDLGAATHADEGGWLLGRVVPSGTSPGLMFDTRPIPVDERTARAVAEDPTPRGWILAVKAALDEGRLDRALLESEDRELVTDVPSLGLVEFATPPEALSSTLDQLARGRDEVGRAAYRILRRVAAGQLDPETEAPYVAAAVVNAHAHTEAWRMLATDTPPERWARWAELVPDPARQRLLRLASMAAAA